MASRELHAEYKLKKPKKTKKTKNNNPGRAAGPVGQGHQAEGRLAGIPTAGTGECLGQQVGHSGSIQDVLVGSREPVAPPPPEACEKCKFLL